MSCSKLSTQLFARFPADQLPPLRIPRELLEKMKAAEKPSMGKFKPGVVDLKEVESEGYRVLKYTCDESILVFIFDDVNRTVLVLFTRCAFSNMCKGAFELAEGVCLSCPEQFFTMHKACAFMDASCNFEETMMGIYQAPKPTDAKKFGRHFKGVDDKTWMQISMIRMFCATLAACTDSEMYSRFQHYAKVIGEYDFQIIEANHDDKIWGVTGDADGFLASIKAKKEQQADLALFDALDAVRGDHIGENRLGLILTDFIKATKDVTFQEYFDAVKDIKFVEIIEPVEISRTCSDSAEEEMEISRTCSDSAEERDSKRICSAQ